MACARHKSISFTLQLFSDIRSMEGRGLLGTGQVRLDSISMSTLDRAARLPVSLLCQRRGLSIIIYTQ